MNQFRRQNGFLRFRKPAKCCLFSQSESSKIAPDAAQRNPGKALQHDLPPCKVRLETSSNPHPPLLRLQLAHSGCFLANWHRPRPMAYNPGMGTLAAVEMDAWLRQGGMVVTASERAARAVIAGYHRARQAERLTAWAAPNVLDWKSFVRSAWTARTADGRLLLNPAQERSIWAGIAAADGRLVTLLEGPRYRLAALAMDAHQLLCSHAPKLLRPSARSGWQNDPAAFSRWLSAFDETCESASLISPARLPMELLELLQDGLAGAGQAARPPLLLAGFDRVTPMQRAVFDAWGDWREVAPGQPAAQVYFYEASDNQAELAACALWCKNKLAANPGERILVVTQNAEADRGEIERALLSHTGSGGAPLFEFSLGIPLSRVALPRAAQLLLRWLSGPIAEHELDWLFSTGHAAASPSETAGLQAYMRALRQRGLAQPAWNLHAFVRPVVGLSQGSTLPSEWAERMTRARRRLDEFAGRARSPLEWAELVPQLLQETGWPGSHELSSAEFQAARSWQQAVETAGSLGFDGRRVAWRDFLSELARTVEETLFAAESHDAPIQMAGPAESAGLTADAIWFLGASEDTWPASSAMHALLPSEVQRETKMPHATPQLDWDLAEAITARLLGSALEVRFSYAKQVAGTESRPSRLISQMAGEPIPLTAELVPLPHPAPLTVSVEDFSCVPYPAGKVAGGASVLTFQSQCPFKAFAASRLRAQDWEPAQAGLTPIQRGQLLHDVMHAVWGGPPEGIRTHGELLALTDRESWVADHVRRVFETGLQPGLRERMPRRYLELEQQRLTGLVTAWLDYEATRIPFEVVETEAARTETIAGLSFKLRLDRLDRLMDGSFLVVDYKSGNVSPRSWDLPRPNDVQLPLYAGFALDEDQELGGLVFAKLRPGELEFAGCIGAPAATLFAGLKSSSSLVKNTLTAEQIMGWRDCIEQLTRDFLEGRAEVDPREPPETCKQCGLQTLCRIQENEGGFEDEEGTEAADE
jgi:probable DNA repair protein